MAFVGSGGRTRCQGEGWEGREEEGREGEGEVDGEEGGREGEERRGGTDGKGGANRVKGEEDGKEEEGEMDGKEEGKEGEEKKGEGGGGGKGGDTVKGMKGMGLGEHTQSYIHITCTHIVLMHSLPYAHPRTMCTHT